MSKIVPLLLLAANVFLGQFHRVRSPNQEIKGHLRKRLVDTLISEHSRHRSEESERSPEAVGISSKSLVHQVSSKTGALATFLFTRWRPTYNAGVRVRNPADTSLFMVDERSMPLSETGSGTFSISLRSHIEVWSFNLRTEFCDRQDGVNGWSKRREGVAAFIRKHRPALICTQEATEPMLQFLVDRLGQEEYSWVATSRTPNRKDEAAGFIFDRRKLSLQDHCARWYGPPNSKPGRRYWDAAKPRTCEIATFRINSNLSNNALVRVLNTHLDHVGVEARRRSAELLAAEVERGKDDESILGQIICGDFNSPKDGNDVYKMLTASEIGLVDTFRDIPPPSVPASTIHKFRGLAFSETVGDGSVKLQGSRDSLDANHIDWILWGDNRASRKGCDGLRIMPVETQVLTDRLGTGHYPSDHFPLRVKFRMDLEAE